MKILIEKVIPIAIEFVLLFGPSFSSQVNTSLITSVLFFLTMLLWLMLMIHRRISCVRFAPKVALFLFNSGWYLPNCRMFYLFFRTLIVPRLLYLVLWIISRAFWWRN